ncbi:hypothetical protein [Aquitalea pelogenes]|uniref:hypothetical protein n=1 Tax=Aquitalea pelogenes TaxID=1293573 RepID=UPI0035AFDC64
MKSFIFPVIKKTITHGHIVIRAESFEKAQEVQLTQQQLDKSFKSNFSNDFSYEQQPYNETYQKIFGGSK